MDEQKQAPGYWGVMPAEVRYAQLPATAKVLYTEISALTALDGICTKDNAYFCELYQISERTLSGHLKKLEKAGFITILDGDGGHGRRRIYAGINPLARNPAKNCGVGDEPRKKLRGNPAENCGVHKVNNQDIIQEDPPKAPQGAGADYVPKSEPDWKPERFDAFWKFYPLHRSKQACIRAWDKLRPSDELLAVIGKALRRQIAEEQARAKKERRDFEWKLHASTFLNQARWTDEAPAETPRSRPEKEDAIWL